MINFNLNVTIKYLNVKLNRPEIEIATDEPGVLTWKERVEC